MKRILLYFFPLILLFTVTGCDLLEPVNHSFSPLDSKIDFKVIESFQDYYTPSGPEIYLQLETEKIYGCINFSVAAKVTGKNNEITVEILGIDKPEICATAIGPATSSIKLENPEGIHALKFINHSLGFTDTYNLLVNDSLIIVDGKETKNTKPLINFFWRYPENSFAYFCDVNTGDSTLCTKFLDTLKSVIHLTEFTFPDFGTNPYVFRSGKSENSIIKYFRYETEDDFDMVSDILKRFMQSRYISGEDLQISILNWRNEQIYSWTL